MSARRRRRASPRPCRDIRATRAPVGPARLRRGRTGRSDPPPAVGAPVSPDAAPRAASRRGLPPSASAALPLFSRENLRLDPASRPWSRGSIPKARAAPPPRSLSSSPRPPARAGLRQDALLLGLARRQPGEPRLEARDERVPQDAPDGGPDLRLRAGNRAFHRNDRRGSDRKSTRLNSSHMSISYAVFCLKKKTAGHAIWAGG